ncbi:hypothetical protein LCGC14_1224280 [marine sediment metagenome]|uniref:Uncharacterized protein n=1 Tax=marine sediment metagenome TaxID=412755 RepID=A0A0F9PEU2_9ZZZZ
MNNSKIYIKIKYPGGGLECTATSELFTGEFIVSAKEYDRLSAVESYLEAYIRVVPVKGNRRGDLVLVRLSHAPHGMGSFVTVNNVDQLSEEKK